MTYLEALEHLSSGGFVTDGEKTFVNYVTETSSMCCEIRGEGLTPAVEGYFLGSLPLGVYYVAEATSKASFNPTKLTRWLGLEE